MISQNAPQKEQAVKNEKETGLHRHVKLPIKSVPRVSIDIRLGPMSPVQRRAWRRFWAKIITEVKKDDNGREQ